MNTDKMLSSWSRCANEFADSSITIYDEKEVQVKKFSRKCRLPSCRGLVATDIALASIKEVEKNELITEWIENGICTPPNSEQNTSCASSPSVINLEKAPEKSPVIKCSRKIPIHTKRSHKSSCFIDLTKSPIIGKRRRSSIDREGRANFSNKLSLDESLSSTNSQKSPILGKAHYFGRRQPKTKRKKLQYQSDLDNDSSRESNFRKNEEQRSKNREKGSSRAEESMKAPDSKIKKISQKFDNTEMSQDIFSEEIIVASPLEGTKTFIGDAYRQLLPINKKKEREEELFCSYDEVKEELKNEEEFRDGEWQLSYQTHKYSLSPVIDCGTKLARNLDFEFIKVEEQSFGSIIQDTEDFPLPKRRATNYLDSDISKQTNDRFVILDSEFGVEKKKFVTDTEHIDCDSSTENEEDNRDLKIEKTIAGVESDSDKTVSDIIEEPMTQDYAEAAESEEILRSQARLSSFLPHDLTSANSQKISDLTLPKNSYEEQAIVDISIETTPPRTQESLVAAPELLDSGKKKSRPKKGSLGARLQKLISGQVSSVRLWRHQMARESAFERSSAPCSTLLVLDTWMQYGKNLYKSKVIDDPYSLLSDYLDEFDSSRLRDENVSRNIVVMTNPDFVGSVKLVPGNFFRIYLPWEIFNRNSGPGNLILHALYFNVVPNLVNLNPKLNSSESQVSKHSNSHTETEIIREYDCPCLQNGKIHDSCLNKFSDHKVDVIAEIIK